MEFSFFPQCLILAKDSVLPEVALKSTLLSLSAGKYLAKSFFFIHSLFDFIFHQKHYSNLHYVQMCLFR